ncbi:MAG: hypothetical protein ABIP20_11480 [Chthoniobacteraceae bacterium]
MGLSYYYEFTAPATVTAYEFETFLRDVEQLAKSLGFAPTSVLNVPFDTPERREFSHRLGGRLTVQDERLKGIAIPAAEQVSSHDLIAGDCRVIPEQGVIPVVTDERGCESCFGFLKFPAQVVDIHENVLAETGVGDRWWFRDFVDSPDRRYRGIVQ